MNESEQRISSPCVRNCCLNDEDICVGCFRSLTEVTGWADADDNERLRFLENANTRRQTYFAKYTWRG